MNVAGKPKSHSISLAGIDKVFNEGKLIVLQGNDPNAANTFDQPELISPKVSLIHVKDKMLTLDAAPYSFSVLRIKLATKQKNKK